MSFSQPQRAARSRTARARYALQLAALRTQFALLDRARPDAAARKAMDIWTTLPGNAGRRKDFRPGPGEVFRLETARGGETVAESWGDGPVVYLVHGWGGWRGQLGAFVAPLVERGHRVVAFDAPGHGEAGPGVLGPGKGTVVEMIEALDAVAEQVGPASGIVGHSLGCHVASAVVHRGVGVERLALVAPSNDFGEIIDQFAGILGFGEPTASRMERIMVDFLAEPIGNFDLGPLGADGAMPATLVVHDRRDKETSFAVGERLAHAWPTADLLATDGLGH
ncbi:MAG: alpha/beta fold hydrolase, partial [Actinomycetales bacterium]|nr:alpha/beta fold hydrolase [Actinomycetales bacterium]